MPSRKTATHKLPGALPPVPSHNLGALLKQAAPLVSQNVMYSISFESTKASERPALARRAAKAANHIGLATGCPVSLTVVQLDECSTILLSVVVPPQHYAWLCRRYPHGSQRGDLLPDWVQS